MNILVTGATGFLGFYVVKRLLEDGNQRIRCFVRPGSDTSKLKILENKYADSEIEYCEGNLTDNSDAKRAIAGVGIVYHLAASLRGATPDMFLNTVVATKNILENIEQNGSKIRFVLISSFSVYGVGDRPSRSLVDENTPLEKYPEKRDSYTFVKHRQEKLAWEYHNRDACEVVVLRPGVIYGPGGGALSARIGVNLFGLFLHFGRDNILPLSYAENCADAIVLAGQLKNASGLIVNVHDDELVTSEFYLKQYKKNVKNIFSVTIPYAIIQFLSVLVEKYHILSKGQLPAIFTPNKSACLWKGNTFSNSKLKSLGWKQKVSTHVGMMNAFAYLRDKDNNH